MKQKILNVLHKVDFILAVAQAIAVLVSYLIGFYLTGRFYDESRYFGAMLAAIASVVALQADVKTSVMLGWMRVLGTFIGAVISTLYLSMFPFSVGGFIVTVFVLGIVCMMLRIPDNGKMAMIALIVIMLISQRNPDIPPIVNGSLRFFETFVGAVIGIAMAWLVERIKQEIANRKTST